MRIRTQSMVGLWPSISNASAAWNTSGGGIRGGLTGAGVAAELAAALSSSSRLLGGRRAFDAGEIGGEPRHFEW
jgi:hypothetical protein